MRADLETRGFAVVRGARDAAELARLVAEFDEAETTTPLNPSYGMVRYCKPETRMRLAKILVPLARRATRGAMNRLRVGAFYATRMGVEFDWHTDTTAWFLYPRYLNFWIPLVKPRRDRTGLSVLDVSVLEARCPEIAAEFRGRGATNIAMLRGKPVLVDSDRLRYVELPDPRVLDDAAVSPEVGPGDVIVLRHDVFHRTQDTDTERLAISFRAVPGKAVVSRQRLAAMGPVKFNNMARMRTHFAKRFATFEIAGRDELTIDEHDAIYLELAAREDARVRELGVDGLNNDQFDDLVVEMARERSR